MKLQIFFKKRLICTLILSACKSYYKYRKSVDFDDLKKEEKVALLLVLLKQLQPYLSEVNLDVTKLKEGEKLQEFLTRVNIQKQSIAEESEDNEAPINKSYVLPGFVTK